MTAPLSLEAATAFVNAFKTLADLTPGLGLEYTLSGRRRLRCTRKVYMQYGRPSEALPGLEHLHYTWELYEPKRAIEDGRFGHMEAGKAGWRDAGFEKDVLALLQGLEAVRDDEDAFYRELNRNSVLHTAALARARRN